LTCYKTGPAYHNTDCNERYQNDETDIIAC
jgi:hypothetical protein